MGDPRRGYHRDAAQNLPDEIRSLPPGRYVVEPFEEEVQLSPDEEEGLRQAITSLEAGKGSSLEDVRDRVLRALRR